MINKKSYLIYWIWYLFFFFLTQRVHIQHSLHPADIYLEKETPDRLTRNLAISTALKRISPDHQVSMTRNSIYNIIIAVTTNNLTCYGLESSVI